MTAGQIKVMKWRWSTDKNTHMHTQLAKYLSCHSKRASKTKFKKGKNSLFKDYHSDLPVRNAKYHLFSHTH